MIVKYTEYNHIDKLRVYQFSPCKMDGTKMREINNKEVRYISRCDIDKHHFINADHHQNKYLSSVAGGRSSGQFPSIERCTDYREYCSVFLTTS